MNIRFKQWFLSSRLFHLVIVERTAQIQTAITLCYKVISKYGVACSLRYDEMFPKQLILNGNCWL
jgi:hypothetical protein